MKNMFFVINKEKVYAYVVSILTIVTLFFMSQVLNTDLKTTEVTSANVVNNENNNVVNDIKQPTLFDNEEEEENMEPLPFDVQDAVCKIITGDALFNYNNDIKVITPYLNNIESRYFKAFGNKENIKSFLTNYIDWIVWEYIEGAGDTADIAYAIINELEKLTSPYKKDRCFVLNLIIELLTDYI